MLREQWLNQMARRLEMLFLENGYRLPNYVVTCGDHSHSEARLVHELVISRRIADPERAADILAHEMAHAAVGLPQKHGPAFEQCATAIGLEGEVGATVGGSTFSERITPWLQEAGPYPHTTLLLPRRR